MSSEVDNRYQKLLLIGTLIGSIGAIAFIIGAFIQFDIFETDTGNGIAIDVIGLLIIGLALAIFIISLITFIGAITPYGFNINDERPSLLALFALFFTPTITLASYTTPIYYFLNKGTELLMLKAMGTDEIGFGFYITFIGVALLFISFFILAVIYLWKRRSGAGTATEFSLQQSSETGFSKIVRINPDGGICI